MNATDDAEGISLTQELTIPEAILNRNSTLNLYYWLNILPLPNGTYDSRQEWVVEIG